jgi:hypothetical protein
MGTRKKKGDESRVNKIFTHKNESTRFKSLSLIFLRVVMKRSSIKEKDVAAWFKKRHDAGLSRPTENMVERYIAGKAEWDVHEWGFTPSIGRLNKEEDVDAWKKRRSDARLSVPSYWMMEQYHAGKVEWDVLSPEEETRIWQEKAAELPRTFYLAMRRNRKLRALELAEGDPDVMDQLIYEAEEGEEEDKKRRKRNAENGIEDDEEEEEDDEEEEEDEAEAEAEDTGFEMLLDACGPDIALTVMHRYHHKKSLKATNTV